MHSSEAPPAPPEFLPGCLFYFLRELRIDRQKMRAQQIQHARHAGDDGNSFAMDGLDEALRLQARFIVHFGAEERWNPQGHELAEDVAERQRVQKMQRVKDALVLQILFHLLLDRIEAREHVAVGVDDTLGFGGRAGSEQDLKGCIEGEAGLAQTERWRLGQLIGTIFEAQSRRVAGQLLQQRPIADDHGGPGIGDHAGCEIERSGGIERDGNHAALHAAEERPHPLETVLTPEDHAVPHGNFAAYQLGGKAIGEVRNFIPRRNGTAVAAIHNDGRGVAVTAVVVEKCGKTGAHKRTGVRFP